MPLILAGWVYSSDLSKWHRWMDTIRWAQEHGLERLVNYLREEEYYYSSGDMFPDYPTFGEQFYLAKARPDPEQVLHMLASLKMNWSMIVGADLAPHTFPLRFTGKKMRRLLCFASACFKPPWGYWWYCLNNRSSFTRLRAKINATLNPHAVDHIAFREVDVATIALMWNKHQRKDLKAQ